MTAPLTGPGQSVLDGGWRCLDFVSDLHLQPGQPRTLAAWQAHLASTEADALFILGDLFEVWVGDDAACQRPGEPQGFESCCARSLHQASQRLDLFFMPGNRDFLLGPDFLRASGMRPLADPTALRFDGRTYLLTHGDALCLDDRAYQAFRAEVRTPAWQSRFLSLPLPQRRKLAREMRQRSEQRKAQDTVLVDVDRSAAVGWLQHASAEVLIHGHTHQPQDQVLAAQGPALLQRWVLSDWDALAQPPRLEVLRLQAGCAHRRIRLQPPAP